MTRHLVIFAACFLVGAAIVAVVRTAGHDPYQGHVDARAQAAGAPAAAADPHAGHAAPAPAAAPAAPVNTVCAICGMPVNPALPTATYEGKVIGFGCKACPPKFAADPAKYGPAALRNQVVEE